MSPGGALFSQDFDFFFLLLGLSELSSIKDDKGIGDRHDMRDIVGLLSAVDIKMQHTIPWSQVSRAFK